MPSQATPRLQTLSKWGHCSGRLPLLCITPVYILHAGGHIPGTYKNTCPQSSPSSEASVLTRIVERLVDTSGDCMWFPASDPNIRFWYGNCGPLPPWSATLGNADDEAERTTALDGWPCDLPGIWETLYSLGYYLRETQSTRAPGIQSGVDMS